MKAENATDSGAHTANVKERTTGLITHLRSDIPKLSDARAKALFEVSAEKKEERGGQALRPLLLYDDAS